MARASPYTEDHIRHFRLLSALLDLGTRTLCRKFEERLTDEGYTDLQEFLYTDSPNIDNDNSFFKAQRELLYPHGQDASIETFDISLLTSLILYYLSAYSQHGNKSVKHLLDLRNYLQHKKMAGVEQPDFTSRWSALRRHLLILDRDPDLSNEIDKFETQSFSDAEIKTFLQNFNQQLTCVGEQVLSVGEQVSEVSGQVLSVGEQVSGQVLSVGEQVSEVSGQVLSVGEQVSGQVLSVGEQVSEVSGQVLSVGEQVSGQVLSVGEQVSDVREHLGAKIDKIAANRENPRLERSLSQEIEDKHKAKQRVQKKDRKDLLQQLRETLKKDSARYSTIQLIPWDKTAKRNIDDIYIPLNLQEKRETDTREKAEIQQFKSLEDAIQKKEYGTVRAIIAADAGCGKSTLCHKVMYDWSKDGSFISDRYELVIVLKARDFSSQQDILLAIMHQIPSKFDKNKDGIAENLKDENTKLLILLDGFDELKDKSKQKDLHRLLDKYLFENCDLIITTRPVFLEKLKEFELLDLVLAISLFEKDDIRAYATKFFEKNKDKNLVDEFCGEVNSRYVNHLAKEPLTLLFLCIVYEHRKCLPKIRTHLYEDLLDMLQRTYTEKGRPEISDEDWNQLLLCLGNLAFNKLTEKEGGILVFKEKDVKKYSVDLELACAVGLLTRADTPQEEPVSEYSHQSIMNKYDKFYQFAHLSLQECLAARYFYNTFDNVASNQNLKTLQQQAGHLYNYTIFVGGYVSLDKEVNDEKLSMLNILLYAVFKYLSSGFYNYIVKDIEFWEETGRNPLYKWVVVDNDTINHYYTNVPDRNTLCVERVRYLDIPGMADKELHNIIKCERGTCLRNVCNILKDTRTLEHVILQHLKCDCENRTDRLSELIQNNKNIEKFCIEDCDISSDIIESMVTHLPACLTVLSLTSIPLEDRVCYMISKLPNTIERISLKDCCITKHETSISQSISEFTTLKNLNLSDNNRLEKGVESIIANLNNSVCDLHMSNCGITETVGESMAPHLAKLIALKELKLSGNPISGGAVTVLEHLSDSIQYLYMENCEITLSVGESMAPHLTKLKALQKLKLSGNPIGGGAVAVVEHLSDYITRLHMDNCGITQTAAEGMASHLTKLKALNRLKLCDNPIGGGAVAVVKHLSHSIECLHMNNCGITTEHVRNMATHLNDCKSKKLFLSLFGYEISEDDQNKLSKMIKSSVRLWW